MTKQEAIELLDKFLNGERSKEDVQKLYKWINQLEHVDALSQWMEHNWEEASKETQCDMEADLLFRHIKEVGAEKQSVALDSTTSKKGTRRLKMWLRGVAAVMLPVMFMVLGYKLGDQKVVEKNADMVQTIVPRGQKAQLVLADGTKVWLNSETVITYPSRFDRNKREVSVTGEAYFEVAKDKEWPFFVKSKGMNVRVLGTGFNVLNYENEEWLETTLIHGSVEMDFPALNTGRAKRLILKPHQRISYKRGSKQLKLAVIDPDGATSWTRGKLVFRSENFERLARKLERWYDVKIHFMDKELKEYRYTGTFDRETVEQAVNALRLTSPFKYTMDKRDIYISIIKKRKKK